MFYDWCLKYNQTGHGGQQSIMLKLISLFSCYVLFSLDVKSKYSED